jgi:DNA modification methylase
VPIESLRPYARNPRTHSDDQVAKIAASIVEFGWTMPILVDDNREIIAGHGRHLAASRLGLAEVPVIRLAHLSPEQVRAYRIADNKLTELSAWNDEWLALEMHELNGVGFDLALTGFGDVELDRLLAALDEEQPITALDGEDDDAPEPPAQPVSRVGDLWQLGGHRLLCGDATHATDVERLLAGEKPHLMVTDPPYGIDYDPDWRNRAERANGKPIGGSAIGRVANDDRADWAEAYKLFPGDVAYVWHPAGARQVEFFHSLVAAGFEIRMQIIWAKSHFPIGRGNYHVQHEPCWYAVRKGRTAHWQGARDQSTLWQIAKPSKNETGHSTQKPVECMRRPMVNNSAAGDAVYDPFVGSGTTLIAAETTGRRVYALEIAPQYVDVAVLRWQQATGKQATLDGDGRTFDAIAAERLPEAA